MAVYYAGSRIFVAMRIACGVNVLVWEVKLHEAFELRLEVVDSMLDFHGLLDHRSLPT